MIYHRILKHVHYLPFLLMATGATACDPGHEFVTGYESFRVLAYGEMKGAEIGQAGSVALHANEVRYANSIFDVIDAEQLETMSPAARRLIERKLLLRRLAISQGMNEDIYSTREAAAYLVPRLERLMEDYYYYHHGNYEEIERDAERLKPDDAALRELLNNDPRLAGRDLSTADLAAERDRLIRLIVRRRQRAAREAIIEELLARHPIDTAEGE